ncbi:MAG TPA: S8 family serine peptidase [Nocardioides sp.]|nr:S8 family serine peptidase [Nocardioides sp.]
MRNGRKAAMRRQRRTRRALGGILGVLLVGSALAPLPSAGAAPDAQEPDSRLYLVTLDGAGTAGYHGILPRPSVALSMRLRQERLLDRVDAPEPTYRWTTALNGFAVRLTDQQALELESADDVALVEPNQIRRVAGAERAEPAIGLKGPRRGGAGTVVGVIDTGLAPEHPLFAAAVPLGKEPRDFSGTCEAGDGWDADDCDDKVVGARWFVEGFGEHNVRSTAYLSPRDSDGHGTQIASIAAGNAGVPVRVNGEPMGRYGGMAPQARIAVYKACWGAPDPADDGCATADLVTAIDRASGDGVDVISLAVGGPAEIDTVERALLGAAEADIVVAAAAGNAGTRAYAAHPSPWVTTVGGTTGRPRLGRVVATGGPRLEGAMVSTRTVRPSRLVLSERVRARGASRDEARVCAPDSLDARRVAGAIVLCQRGSVGRVDKSRTVRLADGAGMVLVNVSPGSVSADFHGVPTVHLTDDQGRALRRWAARHPAARVALRPVGVIREPRSVARWSSPGSPLVGVLKPDVVAPAAGVLGAVPGPEAWDFVTGTSAAAAYTAGAAATLLARTGWPATTVRSALATTAAPLPGDVLHSGTGRLRPDAAVRPGLVYEIDSDDYRSWLSGRRRELNTPSVLLVDGERRTRRTITNILGRARYFSSSAVGFRRDVSVRPAAVRLGPGESATFVIRVRDSAARSDDGRVVWRGATGTVTSIPVQISR